MGRFGRGLSGIVSARPYMAVPININAIARQWLKDRKRIAVATVISTWGSAPVPVGGQLVCAADGDFQGSVSGGCVENDVILAGRAAIDSGSARVLDYGVSDETAWGVGLPCGGGLRIFLEALDTDALTYLERIADAERVRQPLVIEKSLDGSPPRIHSSPATDGDVIAQVMQQGLSRLVLADDGPGIFFHAVMPPVRLVLVGATHIAQVLSDLAIPTGMEVIIVDPRAEFASAGRFPGATRAVAWPDRALGDIALDARTAVITLSHVGHIDDDALRAALRSPAFYIGALGSRRNHAARLKRLEAAGVGADDSARIHGPVGLAIGALGPSEIAVSILADVIRKLRCG